MNVPGLQIAARRRALRDFENFADGCNGHLLIGKCPATHTAIDGLRYVHTLAL
jgi:hypothetical protein